MWRYPHVIRLRGFWQSDPTDKIADEPSGVARHYRRRFGAPTGLDYHEQVWLVCEELIAPGTVSLNGEPLGQTDATTRSFECDVTARLLPRNELCLAFTEPLPAAAYSGGADTSPARSTRLEIRSTATPP